MKLKYIYLAICLSLGQGALGSGAESDLSQQGTGPVKESAPRDPASSLETKKDIANQNYPNTEAEESRLLRGEWRESLSSKGFDFEAFLFVDGVSNQSGGVRRGTIGFSNFELMFNGDLEKIAGWTGASLYIHHHTHSGVNPTSEYVGDANGVNSYAPIDKGDSFISQLYLKQSWSDGKWDALLGLYDLTTEFMVTESSLSFLNNAFLLGLETYPAGGAADLSVYPVNGPGFRLKWFAEDSGYVMAAITSAVARDPAFDRGLHPVVGNNTGYYHIVEAGLQKSVAQGISDKYALAVWSSSKQVPTLEDGSQKSIAWGSYVLVDHHFGANDSVFARLGMANEKVAEVSGTVSLGVNHVGVFTSDDSVGFGVAQSRWNPAYRKTLSPTDGETVSSENIVELVYRVEVVPGFVLTPDLQKIFNPGMSKEHKESTVASLRSEFSF